MKCLVSLFFLISYLAVIPNVHVHCNQQHGLYKLIAKNKGFKPRNTIASTWASLKSDPEIYSPVTIGNQKGMMKADKISKLPGQPPGVKFNQYSGYVTVEPKHGRALFYYFVESPEKSSSNPLVLWLNGGPGCSSLGSGAMMELGPFRVKPDGKTLYHNPYAWNKVANILFLESPAGVGFSYSNTTADYEESGDKTTAEDSYAFLVNWLERFPKYKSRDFYITGESYGGHYVPELAQLILHKNKNTNQTVINLKGIAIGNGWIDDELSKKGQYDFFWTHALISDDIHDGIRLNCHNFSSPSELCEDYKTKARHLVFDYLDIYNIYAPLCGFSNINSGGLAPCTENYIFSYLNIPEVQAALHANVTGNLPGPWESCNDMIHSYWNDWPSTVLPVIQELMEVGIRLWIYSGDIDGIVPITATKLSINKINPKVKTPWYAWSSGAEVGGYAVGYENLTLLTVRGAGHFVPSNQPVRALTLFASFIQGSLPPKAP